MQRHGTVINANGEAVEFRYGVLGLLGAISDTFGVWRESDEPLRRWPYRTPGFHYDGVMQRLGYTLSQVDRAAGHFENCRVTAEDPRNHPENLAGEHIVKLAPVAHAYGDMMLYLDSILHNLKQHVDALAAAIKYLYPPDVSPSDKSFTQHRRWFVTKNADIDPGYARILDRHREWYDRLAGHEGGQRGDQGTSSTGLRTAITHRYPRVSYGLKATEGTSRVRLGMWTTDGISRQRSADDSLWFSEDLRDDVQVIVAGYYEMLDDLYHHLANRVRPLVDDASPVARVLRDEPPFATFREPLSQPASFNHWPFPRIGGPTGHPRH